MINYSNQLHKNILIFIYILYSIIVYILGIRDECPDDALSTFDDIKSIL